MNFFCCLTRALTLVFAITLLTQVPVPKVSVPVHIYNSLLTLNNCNGLFATCNDIYGHYALYSINYFGCYLFIQEVVLGKTSLSTFGFYGAVSEIVIIFYILIASLAGLYSLCPRLKPQKHDTDMTKIVYNCAVLLILSSALPVLCRILGKSVFLFILSMFCIEMNCLGYYM